MTLSFDLTRFPHTRLRFVTDAGMDDQKVFHQMDLVRAEFVIRVCHQRKVEVYDERLDRWEPELLGDLTATVHLPLTLHVAFTYARKVREVDVALGWLKIRIAETQPVYWILVAHDPDLERDVVLITNIPTRAAHDAKTVYTEWRYRPRQEDGLDVEDVRVHTLERMRRIFVLVLLAALFVYHIDHTWPQHMIRWIRRLGGKLGLTSDLDGPYVLLAGIQAIFVTIATLTFATHQPFPGPSRTCG